MKIVKEKAEDYLLQTGGLAPNVKGFRYIVDAVDLIVENPDYVSRITSFLYPEIAKRNDTTASRVERAIRHAIEIIYDNCDMTEFIGIFGNISRLRAETPTNSAFLSAFALKVRRDVVLDDGT